jgi:hypothetical protein
LLSEIKARTEALPGRIKVPEQDVAISDTEINTIHNFTNAAKRERKNKAASRVPLSTNKVIRLTIERFPNEGTAPDKIDATFLSQWQ